MSEVVDIRAAGDPREVVDRAVRLLQEGELVAVPTETVYVIVASGLQPAAMQKLSQTIDPTATNPLALMLSDPQQALDYIPNMPPLGRKLARRCWPGPVTIVFDIALDLGLLHELPSEVKHVVQTDGRLPLRVPSHGAVRSVLRLMPEPLFSAREPLVGASSAAELNDRFGDQVALVIDDGECRYGKTSTVVGVTNDGWKLMESGVVTETMLVRLASEVYMFVCTGNTCRSPMAEGFFRKFLAERLQCGEDDLLDRGYVVLSAGLAAASGAPASPESVAVASQLGVDLHGHTSQPLHDRLLDQADHIYTMTKGHLNSILAARPDLAARVKLLSQNEEDVSDPIGGDAAQYEYCQQEIERHLRVIIGSIAAQ